MNNDLSSDSAKTLSGCTITSADIVSPGVPYYTATASQITGTYVSNYVEPSEEKEKEKENMFNIEFGPVSNNDIRLSMNGLAVKNASGNWVAYDGMSIQDANIINFECADFIYKMPVGQNQLNVGDIIYHNKRYLWIKEIKANSYEVVDPCSSDVREIMLTQSPFGYNFAIKVVNLLGDMCFGTNVSADNPFGNMWMLMLMKDKDKNKDILPFLLMNQGNQDMNPMLLYALMK